MGETSEESNEQITLQDVELAETDLNLNSSEIHYFGADMGLMCAISIGRLTQEEQLLVVHREMVPISLFESRRRELIKLYRCINSVHDVYPYTSEIMKLTEADSNAYGALFTTSKSPEMFTLQEKVPNAEEGKLNLRLLKVNRTAALDTVRDMFKQRNIVMAKTDKSATFKNHYTSLKRVQQFVKEELQFLWVKSDGDDHMLFSLVYLMLAIKMRGRISGWTTAGAVKLVSSYRLKNN